MVEPNGAMSMAAGADLNVEPALAAMGPSRRRAALFFGLVTASTLIFFFLLARIAHMLGGR